MSEEQEEDHEERVSQDEESQEVREESQEEEKEVEEEERPSREQLEQEVEELESSLKRVMADFDNYRKRMMKEKKRTIQKANEDLMTDLCGVLDDFRRALDSDDGPGEEGVEMIYRKFKKTLEDHGLEEIDTEDEEFDPMYHECVISEDVEKEEKDNMIKEEVEKGYELNSNVIRPAKVVVCRYEESEVNNDA